MKKLILDELNRVSVAEFVQSEKTPVTLIMDNIRSALNIGSAFRTADAFALEKIMLCGISAQPPHREILKTAIGATESVAWEYYPTTKAAVEHLKATGAQVWAVEQTDESVPLQLFHKQLATPLALVFGNEVKGVSDDILPLIDGAIEIPQFGTKHSLNVSVCLGITVWEVIAHLHWKGKPLDKENF